MLIGFRNAKLKEGYQNMPEVYLKIGELKIC